MKLYKYYTKEPYSFFVSDTNFPLLFHEDIGRTYYRMIASEKTKIIENKMEQNKAQYNSGRQTANIVALSSENVGKY